MKAPLALHLPNIPQPIVFEAHCLRRLGISTPALPVDEGQRSVWQDLELADKHFGLPGEIELLIGASVLPELLNPGLIRRAALIAQRTAVGWTISGRVPLHRTDTTASSCLALQGDAEPQWHQQLMRTIQRFWEVEDIPCFVRRAPDDEACERIFADHRRDTEGRYVLRLPVKPGAVELLGDSLNGARAALRSLHGRMNQDPTLALEYRRFIDEYFRLGHMRLVEATDSQLARPALHYIAHHAIWQRGDKGRKLRVVFDASRPTSTGRSLNDILYTGRKLQTSLWCVLTRWRRHRVAFCADMRMMYRQIRIDERDVDLQRIIWSPDEGGEPLHFQLLTVTYGESCAPYLSLRVLEQLCHDEGRSYPEAVQAVLKDRYIDDLLTGADDPETARRLRDQLISLLQAGGFPLGKWVANMPELLEGLASEDCLRPTWLQLRTEGPVNELGISWDPVDDSFRLTPPRIKGCQRTKREVLSVIAALFDPCGWLTPAVLLAKLLMQDLWRARLDWDEVLPSSLARRWEAIQEGFQAVSKIVIPRWIRTSVNRDVQLHAFSDASRRAMAAVVYIRVSNSSSPAVVSLLAAKTKLTPIRSLKPDSAPTPRMTIPTLELRAALIAARLLRTLSAEMSVPLDQCYVWSDAQIVLSWLRSSEPVGNSLVDNYISHIQETLPYSLWRYVPTQTNPADKASRGAEPIHLLQSREWWTGPLWLSDLPAAWPQDEPRSPVTDPGQLAPVVVACTLQGDSMDFTTVFSDLNALLRFIVRLRRWVRMSLSRTPTAPILSSISPEEIKAAFVACVSLSQQRSFAHELKTLRTNQALPARSPLRSLDLFASPDGLLRVGGRLHNSHLSYDLRHPPLLHGDSHLARLVIDWAHRVSLHGGFRSTYVHAVRRAWIVGGRRRIRAYVRKCVVCARARAQPLQQKMASLPPERVKPSRPFARVGLDYAGPFQVLAAKGRGSRTTKAYVAVFVCFATKAINLELAGDLTTESLMGVLTRFCSRRGRPGELWSDNATHFHRADLDLCEAFTQTNPDWTHISEKLAVEGISWRFIPPAAPHFGGLWEAGVKSFKTHLRGTVGSRHLTYEEFTTLLASIEAILNCRPITPLSGHPEDLEVLTPGHFLVGSFLTAVPDFIPEQENVDHLTRWKLVTGLRSQFWHHWSREYLNSLQQRHKWTRPRRNLRVGDFVIILDATLLRPNGRWPLGRVVQVHPGPDGLVRAATVRTSSGDYTRPIVKLSSLPLSEPNEARQTPAGGI